MRSRWIHFVRPGAIGSLAASCAVALLSAAALAAPASAGTTTIGPALSAGSAPTLDTANGDFSDTGPSTPTEQSVVTNGNVYEHAGEDATFWNQTLASGSVSAPDGQVVSVNIEGCALKDTTAPTDASGNQFSDGTQVNHFVLVVMKPNGDGSWTEQNPSTTDVDGTSFALPWCTDRSTPATGAVNTSTVTTYHPLHMCINNGSTVGFHDIGGFIPVGTPGGTTSGPWYHEGVPFDILSPAPGSTMNSFVGFHASSPTTSTYGPGIADTNQPGPNSGWGQESGQQVMISATVATGDDAYGLCPGGNGVEPANSNTVLCVNHPTDPGSTYGTCGDNNVPVFAPVNTAPPTITGTPQQGQTLSEVHGSWKNNATVYSYQWLRCDGSGSGCAPISGQTGSHYKLAAADVGHTIEVQEWAANRANKEGPVSSAPTAVVTAGGGGHSGGGGGGGTGGSSKFIVGKLRLKKYAFPASKGTTITWQDTKAAKSTLTLTRKGKHKVIWRATHTDSPGANSLRFRDRRLRRGFYTLTLRTTLGAQTKTSSLTMRIVAPPRHHGKRHHSKRHHAGRHHSKRHHTTRHHATRHRAHAHR